MENRVRIALYARISKDKSNQDTENQLVDLRDFVARKRNDGWELAGEYIDRFSFPIRLAVCALASVTAVSSKATSIEMRTNRFFRVMDVRRGMPPSAHLVLSQPSLP